MHGHQDLIRILHVDDSAEFADLTAEMLEREDDRFTVETAYSAGGGMEKLAETDFDCIVSDYDMPGRDGIEFLDDVREEYSDLPFILFTGWGSEEVASEAISAGVTDYLQKESAPQQYELLANRIDTAVGQYQATRELERQNDLFAKAQDIANVGAWEYDVEKDTTYATDETLGIHGLPPGENVDPEKSIQYFHPEDRDRIHAAFQRAIEEGVSYDLELRLIDDDGRQRWVRTRGQPQTENGEIVRVRGTLQDITEQKHREKNLERQNERLEEFAHVVSHDIQTPLQVASGQLDLAEETGDEEAFEQVRQAHDRIESLIDNVLSLAQQGLQIGETETVEIGDVARDAWETVDTSSITLKTVGDLKVEADPDRLRQLFENLLQNAVEHAGKDVTVTIGPIEPMPTTTRESGEMPIGFHVSDDGPGIPEQNRDNVFEAGYSTTPDGTGFGLSIVKEVALAHNWDIQVTNGTYGGARFEITGVGAAA